MDDIVAVEVTLESGDRRYFLTWGRIQDAVDPRPLAQLVLDHCHGFALGGAASSVRVCRSLRAASAEPYFHEALFAMSRIGISFGPEYERWKAARDAAMQAGKELYYLGQPGDDVDESSVAHAVATRVGGVA